MWTFGRLEFIAFVINMFRLEEIWSSPKSPLAPLFFKGGKACTPAFFLVARAVLNPLYVFTSPTFDKGGQGDFNKAPIGINF